MTNHACLRSRAGAAITGGLIALSFAVQSGRADSVEDFYKGKNVNLIIGYSVGGGYDLYGRLLARHLGKHIPGHARVSCRRT